MARKLRWTDVRDIAIELEERHPDVDNVNLRFTDLHRWVMELPDFEDDAMRSNEKILEAIQAATVGAAEHLRIANEAGKIAVGMPADIVAVSGDPLRSNCYLFVHNGMLGFPTTKTVKLPQGWRTKLRDAES